LELNETATAVENGWGAETNSTDPVVASNPSVELSDNRVLPKEQCSAFLLCSEEGNCRAKVVDQMLIINDHIAVLLIKLAFLIIC